MINKINKKKKQIFIMKNILKKKEKIVFIIFNTTFNNLSNFNIKITIVPL